MVGVGRALAWVAGTALAIGFVLVLSEDAQAQVRFVATGVSGTIVVSSDGITWTAPTGPPATTNPIWAVWHNGTHWLAAAGGQAFVSPNGNTWTTYATPFTSTTWGGAKWVGGNWIVAGGSGQVIRSTDGATWTLGTWGFTDNVLGSGVDGANKVMLVGNGGRVTYSTNGGASWTTGTGLGSGSNRAVQFGNNVWIASGSSSNIYRSTDGGATWSVAASVGAVNDFTYAAGIFVLVGSGGNLQTSPDGITWTPQVSAFPGAAMWEVEYCSGLFVAVGPSGNIMTSPNGVAWTPRVSPTTNILYALASVCSSGGSGAIPSPATTSLVATPTSIVANGASTSAITVRLRDANGTPLSTGGHAVSLMASAGTLGAVTDHTNGTYSATLTSTTLAQTSTVTGTLNGVPITMQANVQFLAGAPNATRSLIDAAPTSLVADGVSTSTVTVYLRDTYNNPLTTGGHAVTLATTRGSLGAVVDLGNGQYRAILTAPTVVGTATVTGTVGGQPITDTAAVAFVAGPPSTATSILTAIPTVRTADGTSTSGVWLRLRDAQGNAIPGGGAPVALATTHGTLGPVTDHANGTYSATLTAPTVVGQATLTATLGGSPITDTALVDFVAGPVSMTQSTLVADPTHIVLTDPAPTSIATLRLLDAHGNAIGVGGHAITFATTHGAFGTVTDLGDGRYRATLATTVAGTATVTALLAGTPFAATATVTFVAGPVSMAHATIDAAPATLEADGASTSTATLQLRDSWGNPQVAAPGTSVTLTATLGTMGATTSLGGGAYRAYLTAPTAIGVADVRATVGGSVVPVVRTVTFIAGPPSLAQSALLAAPPSIEADGTQASTVTLTLRDAFGNRVMVGGHAVTMASNLGTLSSVADNADGTYSATLRSLDPGVATVSATLGGGAIAPVDVDLLVPVGPMAWLLVPSPVACLDRPFAVQAIAHHAGHSVTTWTWTHGDGSTHTAAGIGSHRTHHAHTYTSPGFPTMSVLATFDNAATATAQLALQVYDCSPPLTSFTYHAAGLAVTFDDTSFSPGGLPLTRTWHFGDGVIGQGPDPTHVYARAGDYRVLLVVTDVAGSAATFEMGVTVDPGRLGQAGASLGGSGGGFVVADAGAAQPPSGASAGVQEAAPDNRPPVAVARSGEAVLGRSVQLDGAGSHDPDGDRLTFAWLQTGGPPVVLVGPDAQPAFRAQDAGRYVFQLRVTDGLAASTAEVTIDVAAPQPALAPAIDARPQADGVAFSAVAAGASPSAQYVWDFGDGTTAEGRDAQRDLPEGTHWVRLTVTDGGRTYHAQQLVEVPAPQPVERATPQAAPQVQLSQEGRAAHAYWVLAAIGAIVVVLAAGVLVVFARR